MKELSMLIILYRAINNQMVLKHNTVVTDAKMFSCSQQSTHRGVFFFGHSFFVFLSSKCSILFACFLHSAPPSISSFCFYTGDNQLLGPAHMIKRSLTSRINGRVHYCNVSTVYMDEFIIVRCSGFCIHERSYLQPSIKLYPKLYFIHLFLSDQTICSANPQLFSYMHKSKEHEDKNEENRINMTKCVDVCHKQCLYEED